MADEKTGSSAKRAQTTGEDIDRSPTPRHEREEGVTGMFSLPPISLPEMQFPERLRVLFPETPTKAIPSVRLRTSWVLAIVLLLDLLDATVGLFAGFGTLPWVRGIVGLAVSVVFAGPAGLLYGWELVATLAGFGWLALAPTATLLIFGRLLLRQ